MMKKEQIQSIRPFPKPTRTQRRWAAEVLDEVIAIGEMGPLSTRKARRAAVEGFARLLVKSTECLRLSFHNAALRQLKEKLREDIERLKAMRRPDPCPGCGGDVMIKDCPFDGPGKGEYCPACGWAHLDRDPPGEKE